MPRDRERDYRPPERIPHEWELERDPPAEERSPHSVGRGLRDDHCRVEHRDSPTDPYLSRPLHPFDEGAQFRRPPVEKKPATPVESILDNPGRDSRPDRVWFINSGKCLAALSCPPKQTDKQTNKTHKQRPSDKVIEANF